MSNKEILFLLELVSLTCSSPRSRFNGSESVFVSAGRLTCSCDCPVVIPATSSSQNGSITSQLFDVFTSHGNTVSLIDEIGESQFDGPAACRAALGKSTSNCVDPARLRGRANGLVDAEGIPVGVAGAVLAPTHEPGLANGE